jgi:prepilin peptidase CpaA
MEAIQIFQAVCPWLVAGVLIVAALSDACSYEIPDWTSGGIGLLYFGYTLTALGDADFAGAIVVALVVFFAGVGLFTAGAFGGGDVKLLSATSLWAGPGMVLSLLFVTALAGGVLSIMILARSRLKGRVRIFAKPRVPYGIAIAAGGLYVAARIAAT